MISFGTYSPVERLPGVLNQIILFYGLHGRILRPLPTVDECCPPEWLVGVIGLLIGL